MASEYVILTEITPMIEGEKKYLFRQNGRDREQHEQVALNMIL
jgi:hypothetical protein